MTTNILLTRHRPGKLCKVQALHKRKWKVDSKTRREHDHRMSCWSAYNNKQSKVTLETGNHTMQGIPENWFDINL